MIYTTLNAIRAHSPCADGWVKLLNHLGKTAPDDDPLPLVTVLDSNGLSDALWCLRAVPHHDRLWRHYAVWCARQVQHLLADPRSIAALDVAARHADGLATDEELAAAEAAAWAAEAAAWAAWAVAADAAAAWAAAARAAAWAAGAAAEAAEAAADAAWAAREAAGAAARAAREAAGAAAGAAQEAELRRILTEGGAP